MHSVAKSGDLLISAGDEAQTGAESRPARDSADWRKSLSRIAQPKEHDTSEAQERQEASSGAQGGVWRSSVLAHSSANNAVITQPNALEVTVKASQEYGPHSESVGLRPPTFPDSFLSTGPGSARELSAPPGPSPQLPYLRDPRPIMSADGKPRAANGPGPGVRSMSPTVMSSATTGDVKLLGQTAVMTGVIGKPDASGKGLFINVQRHSDSGLNPKRIEGEAASSDTPAGDIARVGWRSSVSMASQKTILVGAGDATDPALAASSHSLWRSITKTFTGRIKSSNAETHLARTSLPSRFQPVAASLPTDDGSKTAVGLASSTKEIGIAGMEYGAMSDEERDHMQRVTEAAERAVQEFDAEAEAIGTSVMPGDADSLNVAKNASRRLRFNPANQESTRSSFSGSTRTSQNGSSTLHTKGNEKAAEPEELSAAGSPIVGVQSGHGVLKKEGTSKQLRLGLGADGSDEEPTTPKAASGWRACKLEGASAAGSAVRTGGEGSGTDTPKLSAIGIRPDSAVVPARLHVNTNPSDMQLHDLETTLMTPSELLPPGESLPPPFRRSPGLLARSVGGPTAVLVAGADAGMLMTPAVAVPDTSAVTITQPGLQVVPAMTLGGAITVATTAVQWQNLTTTTTTTTTFDRAATVEHKRPEFAISTVTPVAQLSAPAPEPAPAAPIAAVKTAAFTTSKALPAAAPGSQPSLPLPPPAEKPSAAPAPVKARSTIKLPIITTGHWDSLIFSTVWRVGRVFGFQAFNVRPGTQDDAKREYVPAAIFCAADHLIQLLVKNGYVRRDRGEDTDDERFAKALFEFHSTIFYSYEMQWTKMQRLSPRAQRFTDALREKVFSDHQIINGLLCELALFFLIYTEAANVRFCPEAMWMIYWCMNHSYVMGDLWNQGSPDRVANGRERLPQLRNTYQHLIRELQVQIHIRPTEMRPEDCGKMSSIMSRLSTTDVPISDRELLADLISYGDGGFFMDRIVSPIFTVMCYEIDHLSTQGVDTAHRLGYDDFNDSLTCRDIVYGALLELRVTPYDIATGALNDAYHSLTSLGFQGRTVINNKFDSLAAAEWWRKRVFVKTYRERRSWAGIYRAFFRVYVFHFIIFHLMQAQAFAGWNWRVISSAVLTHAWLTWLERVANWMMTMPTPEPLQTTMTKIFDRKGFFPLEKIKSQMAPTRTHPVTARNADRLQHMKAQQAHSASAFTASAPRLSIKQLQAMQPERVIEIEGAPMYGLLGGLLEWLIIATALSVFYTLQFSSGAFHDIAYNNWGYVAAGYTGLHLLHFLITTRDGYVISLTEALRLPAYFQNWSARPQPKTWMYSNMNINWKNFSINVLFWVLVLAMKIPFDYFVIHKPVVKPIRLLFTRKWLGCKGPVYRLPGGVTLPCIGGDWILVTVRLFPFIIVSLFDTALFYQFIVTAFGVYHGLIKLDLGVISTWDDLVREFHKSPPRWWMRCMSFTGNDNQRNLLFHTISVNAQAASNADDTGGEGVSKTNVAISDGLMFKIKIVTPEEIKAKQGLMLKERRINMQAGKAGPSSEVEFKAVKPLQDKATASAGTAANASAGTGAAAATGAGAKGAAAGAKGAAAGVKGAAAGAKGAAANGGTTAPGAKNDAKAGGNNGATGAKPTDATRPMAGRGGRAAIPLVGQDYKDGKDAQNKPIVGAIFGWRGQGAEADAAGGPRGLGRMTTRNGNGALPPLPGAAGAGGDAQAADTPAGGVANRLKAIGTAAISAAILARNKGNQVQPEPVAEAEERRDWSDGRAATPRAQAALQPKVSDDGQLATRHPAWQPEDLLGSGHSDYDARKDPMSPAYTGNLKDDERNPKQRWRLWPWRVHKEQGHDAEAPCVPGPAMASMRVHGWASQSEIQPWQGDDEDGDLEEKGGGEPQGLRRPDDRVYHGALGEAVTLVGSDGKPVQDGGNGAPAETPRAAPFVLLSEVPIMRFNSEGGSLHGSDREPSFTAQGDRGSGNADEANTDDMQESGPQAHAHGRPVALPKATRFSSAKFDPSTVEDLEDDGKSFKHKKGAKPKGQRRASLLHNIFGLKAADRDGSDDDVESYLRAKSSNNMFQTSSSFKRAPDSSTHGNKDRSVKGGVVGRRASMGPGWAAQGGGLNRKSSFLAVGGLNRKSSFVGPGVQRLRSISAANTTNFEQRQIAKKWERQHSIAAQIMKKDIATRTTSMVLLGTEELNNLEEDELDVVSEQMMMWSSFAEAWDAVCDDLREGDLISDKEMSLLKFVRLESSGKLYGLRPILLPTFFFAGQIRKVVDTGRVTTAQVMVLTEFRVLITWLACQLGIMSGKHAHVIMTTFLYGGIINVKHINMRKKSFDSAIKLISLVDQAIRSREVPFEIKDFAENLLAMLNGLESECYAVQKMWEIGRVSDDELDAALTLFEVVQDMQERIRSDPEDLKQCLKRAVAMNDVTTNTNVLLQVTTVLRQMLTTTSADATPQGEEAQRILGFFINSLGHPSLDRPQNLEFMYSWSVLTPAYEEDVLYALESGLSAEELGLPKKKITDLLSETDDGFSLMAYLRAMFAFEWSNFKERMKRLVGKNVEILDWSQVTELDFGPGGLLFDYRTELQLWASYRGQLLARTVRGMMCYERALKVLCRMEYPAPLGITDEDYNRWVDAMVTTKFEYVVAVQTYGRNLKSKDLRLRQLSQGVDTLVQRFPTLKVAYLDDAHDKERNEKTQYSVLIRNRRPTDPIADPTRPFNKIAEAYRIRLPFNRYSHRGVVLGEGKPENQNHAAVFAFNEGLQAIDMNQDNFLAEALKMRNLLSELQPSNKGAFMLFADDTPSHVLSPHMTAAELRFVILSRMKQAFPTAIVGFREWIFSANTGALGMYAAATEYSFATIQSRIMTKPSRVRMHYGHPDVFNKTHVMTRGGMSKGTRNLHISEDYFIGAAHTLRGARIRYKEYVSCGKGRDMGFDSILGYQKKISGGAGDLGTSREMHRLGTRLDFFRLMAFYHGGIGHFLNSWLTMKAAWYNMWALLLTAMAGAMEVGLAGKDGEVTLTQTYNVQQVLQLGTLAIIPYVGQLILETGVLRTLITVFGQIITGSLFFYIFQQQTVAASFTSVMAYGGMRYIATGRGFSIQTTDFVKMYTMYARTHLYLGFEVLFFCVTLYALNDCASCNYAALTWNSWLLAFVLIACPLWFNPFIFNLSKVQRDYISWKRWLNGDMDASTGTNWYTWNREQLSKARNDDGNVSDAWRNAAREIIGTCMPLLLLAIAAVSRIDFRIMGGVVLENPYMEFLLATALLWLVALCTGYLGHNLLDRAKSKEWRIIRYVLTITGGMLLIVYLAALSRFYVGDGLAHLSRVLYANLLILILVHRGATHVFTQNNAVRDFVDNGYYIIDVLVGYGMFALLALLSFVGVVNLLQSKLLFNEAFSQSVATARIKMQVKRSGKQIKRKPKPGLLMTMEDWMRSNRPSSAAPSLPATVVDGGTGGKASRANSQAPSAMPSVTPSALPSAVPSDAVSAVVSAQPSVAPSRRQSLGDLVEAMREQQRASGAPEVGEPEGDSNRRVLNGPEAVGSRSLRPLETFAGSDGGATVRSGIEGPPDSGLRERRLRFG